MRTPVSLGVVCGVSGRGTALAQAFDGLPQAELAWLCAARPEHRLALKPRFPGARMTGEYGELLEDDSLDAVVVATGSATHHELALQALEADKHVFVDKPLALSAEHARELVRVAEQRQRCLMVGHVMLFDPAVRKLKELLDRGKLGDIFYLYSNRQSLGEVRQGESVIWSLGVQDVAVLLYLLDDEPVEVSARGESYIQPGVADVAFCYLKFATGISAHLHVSWLDPHTLRRLTVVGSEGMAVIDYTETERKLTLYEKTATPRPIGDHGESVELRFGDITCPSLPADEPLRVECEHFVSTIRSGAFRSSRAQESAAVVEILEALQRSLDGDGTAESAGGVVATPSVVPIFDRLAHRRHSQ